MQEKYIKNDAPTTINYYVMKNILEETWSQWKGTKIICIVHKTLINYSNYNKKKNEGNYYRVKLYHRSIHIIHMIIIIINFFSSYINIM